MIRRALPILATFLLIAACGREAPDDSTYVLIRYSGINASLGLRAYFMDGDAQLNGVDCRELMALANEAVDTRTSRGEAHLVKYECVSLRDARERGFK